jgi:hypothetical protein
VESRATERSTVDDGSGRLHELDGDRPPRLELESFRTRVLVGLELVDHRAVGVPRKDEIHALPFGEDLHVLDGYVVPRVSRYLVKRTYVEDRFD